MTADEWTNPKEGTGEVSYSIHVKWKAMQLLKMTRTLMHGYGKFQGVFMGEQVDSENTQLLCKRRMEMRTFLCICLDVHIRKRGCFWTWKVANRKEEWEEDLLLNNSGQFLHTCGYLNLN